MKRMMITGLVALGLARGAVAQDQLGPVLDAIKIAQLEEQDARLFAQNAQSKAQTARVQMQDAQLEVQKAQALVNIAADTVKQRMEPGTYLGIATSSIPAALREQLQLKRGVGLVVERVEKESPAEQAGIKQYDIIEKLDDQILITSEQFAGLVRMQKPGTQIKLAVIRQGQPQAVTATLIEKQVPAELFLWKGDLMLGDPEGRLRITTPRIQELKIGGPIDPRTRTTRNMTITSSVSGKNLTVTRDGENTHLLATDAAGNTLFDGDVNTDDQWKDVPPDVAREAQRLMPLPKNLNASPTNGTKAIPGLNPIPPLPAVKAVPTPVRPMAPDAPVAPVQPALP